MLWERREWYESRLGRSLRNDPMFKLALFAPVHRLLHIQEDPIPLPEVSVLEEMESLKHLGMLGLIDSLDHPIAYHLEKQMNYQYMPVARAVKRLGRVR
jgi:hypothetical protein